MKDGKRSGKPLSQDELKMMERLRRHPEMLDRVQSILEIAENREGPLKTADEVEELLVQEMRKLGNTTMRDWAGAAQEQVADALRAQEPTLCSRKKNAEVVDGFRIGGSARVHLEQRRSWLSATAASAAGSQAAVPVGSFATSADGFWLRTFFCAGGAKRAGTLWF